MSEPRLLQPQEHVLATLEADGSRRWLHPRLSMGTFWHARRLVAYLLILIFAVVPFIRFNGKPLVLLNVATRHFTILGYTFLPRDAILFALLMVSGVLSIFFFTAIMGRVWCGWGCPQTVWMEFVYRPIERACLGRAGVGGKPAKGRPFWRYLLMYFAFFLVSLHLANTALAYFVGVDQIRIWTTRSPLEHPSGFLIVLAATVGMMFDFCYFREQTCTIACPYGRFQSVLLDNHSMVVRYDRRRGEPRTRVSGAKGQGSVGAEAAEVSVSVLHLPILTPDPSLLNPLTATRSSDCVDCTMCVQVCPTGIDIRDGTQLECINCAQCVDACDAVMLKLGRPTGLIRYASLLGLEGRPARMLRPRTIIYATIITGILSLLTYLLATKNPTDVLLVRNQGLPFVIAPDGRVENTIRVQLTNRTDAEQPLKISLVTESNVTLLEAADTVSLAPEATIQKPIHLLALSSLFIDGKHTVTFRVTTPDGTNIDRVCQLFGPLGHYEEHNDHSKKPEHSDDRK